MKRILCVIVSTLAVLLLFAGGCSVARRPAVTFPQS